MSNETKLDQKAAKNEVAQTPTTVETPAGATPEEVSGAPAEAPGSPISETPVIARWKTSIGFSILGIICGFVLFAVIGAITQLIIVKYLGNGAAHLTGHSNGTVSITNLAGAPTAIICLILMIVYAAVFYPSYFQAKPRLKSNKAISFANLLFGGIIFGCLWNGNLTKSRAQGRANAGSSGKVAIVLFAITIVFGLWSFCTTSLPLMSWARQHPVQSNASSSAIMPSTTADDLPSTVSDDAPEADEPVATVQGDGLTLTIPDGWEEMGGKSSSSIARLRPKGSYDTGIFVYSEDIGSQQEAYNDLTEQDIRYMAAQAYPAEEGYRVKDVEKVTAGDRAYWTIAGQMTHNDKEVYTSLWLTYHNERLYYFEFDTYSESIEGAEFDDFKEMVAATKYE